MTIHLKTMMQTVAKKSATSREGAYKISIAHVIFATRSKFRNLSATVVNYPDFVTTNQSATKGQYICGRLAFSWRQNIGLSGQALGHGEKTPDVSHVPTHCLVSSRQLESKRINFPLSGKICGYQCWCKKSLCFRL